MSENSTQEWELLQKNVSEWAEATFKDSDLHSKMEHIRRETYEIEERPNDPFEWADVMIIFLHSMASQGMSMEDLLSACTKKFYIIQTRNWGQPDEHGVVQHIKEKK